MKFDTTSDDRDVLVVDLDWQQSAPLKPPTPQELERLKKIREKYLQTDSTEDRSLPLPETGIET